jgi:hypothetical protein
MAENLSPEERLFRVIQEQKNSSHPRVAGKKAWPGFREFRLFFANLIPGKAAAAQLGGVLRLSPAGFNLSGINLRVVNKTLAAILAVLVILILYSSAFGRRSVSGIVNGFSKIKYQAVPRRSPESLKPLGVYTEQVRKRDIFKPAPSRQEIVTAGSALQAMVKDLRLVGIYQGADSEAIVEDRSTKKIYYLNKASQINGMTVNKILEDRVVLKYGGDEAELL